MGYRAARWARKFRNAIAAILPSGDDSSAKYTDAEVRKLGNVLWKDIVAWAQKTDTERVLRLFKADTQTPKTFGWDGKAMANVPRGMDPDTPPAEWSFVPVSDLLLVVGEGLIGMTIEGMFADNNPGHKRKTLMQCYKKKKKPKKAAGGEAKPEDTNGSAAAGGST
uniref:Uncharacterized protein n=1 Tax=Strombidinopsis acuminata TaxID=141414 RepID=A0A7S3VXZ6_9SPIT